MFKISKVTTAVIRLLLLIVVSGSAQQVMAQADCEKLKIILSYDEILQHHQLNSRLNVVGDTINYSLDPIIAYKILHLDSTSTRYSNIYDAIGLVNVFEALVSRQSVLKKEFFSPYITSAKTFLCEQLSQDTMNTVKIRKIIQQKLNGSMIDYSKAYHYQLKSTDVLRGSPVIKVKFVSKPANAKIRYILNGYLISYGKSVPDELWMQADDGEVKELSEATLYTIRARWHQNEPWQQENKEIDKNGNITVVPVNRENK